MDELILHLDEKDHLALAISGLLISVLVWRWTANRFTGIVADESRLLMLAFLTAGLPSIYRDGYFLFWLLLVSNVYSSWPAFALLITFWWLGYSIVFFWSRWLYGELFP